MKKFRFFDLFIFTILMIVCEFLSSFCFKHMSSGFYLSFATLLFIILSIRWGVFAIIPFILSGIPLIKTQDIGLVNGILYYCMANSFAVIPILLYGRRDRNNIKNSIWKLILYILSVLVTLSLGKGIIIYVHSGELTGMYGYFVSMIFTFIINIIIMLIFTRKNSKLELVTDMRIYFDNINNETDQDEEGVVIDE